MEPTYRECPPNSTKQLTLLRRYQRLAEKTVSHAWLEQGLDRERNECSHIKKQRSRSLNWYKRLQLARHIRSTWQGNSFTALFGTHKTRLCLMMRVFFTKTHTNEVFHTKWGETVIPMETLDIYIYDLIFYILLFYLTFWSIKIYIISILYNLSQYSIISPLILLESEQELRALCCVLSH